MARDQKLIVEQLDRILNRFHEVKMHSSDDWDAILEVNTSMLAALERLAPRESQYRRQADQVVKALSNYPTLMGRLGGILKALRNDYAASSMKSLQELIHADLFSDFLDMAEHLLEQGYKDAAAVMAGSVLEEHVRKICQKNGVDTTFVTNQGDTKPKKLDAMNADLTKMAVYNKSDQKAVTAWAEIRNNAAHGKYAEYTNEKVDLMIRGLRNFLSAFPA